MSSTVITNIKQLAGVREETQLLRGKDLAVLPTIENAYLIIEDDTIAGYGANERPAEHNSSTSFKYY